MKINTTMHIRTLERSLFCLLFVLSTHVIGLACSCKGLPDGRPVASEVEKSDFVIIGRTASIDISTAKITVERIYKGNLVVGEQIDFYQNRPDDCRMYFEKVGRKYLLYFTRPKGSTYSASICGRSKRITRASEDLTYLNKFRAFPSIWFAPINDPNKPDWEILPQERQAGEVVLSKRNELGILSNFAATPFELKATRYASVEGFWQMMLYREPMDEFAKVKGVDWKYTREQVAQMSGFEAKAAGTLAEENMKKSGIDWVTFEGKRFPYRSATPGEHYRLIVAAMRAKLEQNPEVKRILLATGDLKLRPDHIEEPNAPPEWKYYDIWMQIRSELQTAMQKPARQ